MTGTVFADTSYFIALVDLDDESHEKVDRFARRFRGTLVTTGCVLLELGAYFSAPAARPAFALLNQLIRFNRNIAYVPMDSALQDAGIELYLSRLDKAWSLADCISSVVMNQRGIHNAATTDHHFTQAGFINVLMDDDSNE